MGAPIPGVPLIVTVEHFLPCQITRDTTQECPKKQVGFLFLAGFQQVPGIPIRQDTCPSQDPLICRAAACDWWVPYRLSGQGT